ncbi:hypothetical protein VKT23_000063 [Stygiomarasmius scandens]|uniref:Uncharacterized protein n=1 Tax=Marasmiellus scandens TaxID=2682957 RepID=A0ABR1K315_9AGAR
MHSRHSFRSLHSHSRPHPSQVIDLVVRADASSSSSSSATSDSSSSLSPESEAHRAHHLLVTGLVLGFIGLVIIGIILYWTKKMNLKDRRKYMERLDEPRRGTTPTPTRPISAVAPGTNAKSFESPDKSELDGEDEKYSFTIDSGSGSGGGANLKKSLSVSAKGLLRSASTSSTNLLRSASSSSTNLLRSKSKFNSNSLAAQITPFSLSPTYGLTSSSQISLHHPSSPNGGPSTAEYGIDTGGTNGYGEGPRFVHTPGQNMRVATRLENGVWVFSDPKRRRGNLGQSHANDSSSSLGHGAGTFPGRSRSGSMVVPNTTPSPQNSLGPVPEGSEESSGAGSDPFASPTPTSENGHSGAGNPFADPLAGLPPARPRPPKKTSNGQGGNSRSVYANSLYSLYAGNRSATSIYSISDPYNPNSDTYEPSGVREIDPAEIPRARPRPANTLLQLQRERNSRYGHLGGGVMHSNVPYGYAGTQGGVLAGGIIPGSPGSGAPYNYGYAESDDPHSPLGSSSGGGGGAWTDIGTSEGYTEEPDAFSQGGHSDAHSLQASSIAREARLREEIERYRRGEVGWGSDLGHGGAGGSSVGHGYEHQQGTRPLALPSKAKVNGVDEAHLQEPLSPTAPSVFTNASGITSESQYTTYAFALPSFENEPLGVELPPPAYVYRQKENQRVKDRGGGGLRVETGAQFPTSPISTFASPISPPLATPSLYASSSSTRTPVTSAPVTPKTATSSSSSSYALNSPLPPIPLSPHLKVGLKRTPSKAAVPMSVSEVDLVNGHGWAVR